MPESPNMSKSLQPFFSYYGSKWRMAPKFPSPAFDTLIEPFAGGAAYSLYYPHKNVVLYDINEKVFGIWDYLIKVKAEEFASLPTKFISVDELTALSQEAKWYLGFCIGTANPSPRKKPSEWSTWTESYKHKISDQLRYIRHWKMNLGSYADISNQAATWFVDPPYQNDCGRVYTCDKIDFPHLGTWCQSRQGQTIVCEAQGANWLPFESLCQNQGSTGVITHEMIWLSKTWYSELF